MNIPPARYPTRTTPADFGSLFTAANIADIRGAIIPGKRQITDREVLDSIQKAVTDLRAGKWTPRPRPTPIVKDGRAALQKLIAAGSIHDEETLRKASPVLIPEDPRDQAALLFQTIYRGSAFIFAGGPYDHGTSETIRPVCEWIDRFHKGAEIPAHVILNPLTGYPAPKKTGQGKTYRGDANIKEYLLCLTEFDDLPHDEQVRFWSAAKLPIVALIDSGGRSIHGWLDIRKLSRVTTAEGWEREIKGRLYGELLVPLGVDAACSNPARLSRLPGHFRKEKGAWQRLLWLSPSGRSIQC